MKKLVVLMAVLALAVPAMADLVGGDRATTQIYTPASATPVGEGSPVRAGPAVYDSLGPGVGGYVAFSPAVGPLGFDDYNTNSGVNLTAMKFVGGVTRANGIMWFEYYDPNTFGFITSFGVLLPQSGNFTWTITFNNPPFVIPHNALFQVVANSTFTGGFGTYSNTIAGQWFLTTPDAVVVGSNSPTTGGYTTTGGANYVQAFSFHVPEPTTLVLFGLGGAVALLRRR